MAHSIELLLDDAADAWVRSRWRALIDAGLPSQGRIAAATNRPHITVVAAEHLHPAIDSGLGALIGRLPLSLNLDGLVTFGDERKTLAIRVARDDQLDEFQAEALAAARPWITAVADHIESDRWTPHITLARRLTPEQSELAAGLIDSSPAASGTQLRRWDGGAKVEKLFDAKAEPVIRTIKGL